MQKNLCFVTSRDIDIYTVNESGTKHNGRWKTKWRALPSMQPNNSASKYSTTRSVLSKSWTLSSTPNREVWRSEWFCLSGWVPYLTLYLKILQRQRYQDTANASELVSQWPTWSLHFKLPPKTPYIGSEISILQVRWSRLTIYTRSEWLYILVVRTRYPTSRFQLQLSKWLYILGSKYILGKYLILGYSSQLIQHMLRNATHARFPRPLHLFTPLTFYRRQKCIGLWKSVAFGWVSMDRIGLLRTKQDIPVR